VNYFGHLVVASFRTASPIFALGAMLPDWAGMCGARLAGAGGELGDGVGFHHETDRVFHALPGFRALEARAFAALEAGGVGRGPARGAAHVAVELVLDGALIARAPEATPLYLAALAAAPEHAAAHGEDPRMARLLERLVAQGVPLGYRDPTEVARRTVSTLARRPRLALTPHEHALLAAALPALADAVERDADALLADLRDALG
jgi:hypothetical protein